MRKVAQSMFAVEEQIAEGDPVVSRTTLRGPHPGEFMGLRPLNYAAHA